MDEPRGAGALGVALAGGGPEGALYEIGALCALEESIPELDLARLDVYVGVSAGAMVAACLANGMSPRDLCRGAVFPGVAPHPFTAGLLYRPAASEWLRRGLMLPRLTAELLAEFAQHPSRVGLDALLTRFARAMPAGVFTNEPLREWMAEMLSAPGRTDDFRALGARLVIVATDLDSGEAVRFGEAGHDDVPVSLAVQASTALPGLYPPVLIRGRHHVDGVLLKTLHASVAFEKGARLLFCVNPLVPIDTADAVRQGAMRRGRLVNRGLPTILSQTFRTLIHSRLRAGFAVYDTAWPDRDVILLEPREDDYRMFFTNVFGYSARHDACEHGYRSARRELLERAEEFEPVLARRGLSLDRAGLADEERGLDDLLGRPDDARSAGDASDIEDRLASALDRLEALIEPGA